MSDHSRNFGLDVMRATAILLVLFAHYFASTSLKWGGFLGVEVFFVLSGFLIGNILIRSLQADGATIATVRTFWLKRWFRTLPNYAFFLVCHFAGSLYTSSQLPEEWWRYFLFLQNFTHYISGFFAESWSLAVEEWFYLLFPILIVVFNRGLKLNHWALGAAVVVTLLLPTLLRGYAAQYWNTETIRGIVTLRLDTMMYGIMTAMIMNWHPPLWTRLTNGFMLIPGLMLIALGLWLYRHSSPVSSIFCFPLVALGVAFFVPTLKNLYPKAYFAPPVIQYISKVSYSTYLLHMPFFFFMESMISWAGIPAPVKFAGRLLMLIAVLLLSYLPYKCIEQPFLGLRQRLLAPQRARAGYRA